MADIKCVFCFKHIDKTDVLFDKKAVLKRLEEEELPVDEETKEENIQFDDKPSEDVAQNGSLIFEGSMGGKNRRSSKRYNVDVKAIKSGEKSSDSTICLKTFYEEGKIIEKTPSVWEAKRIEIDGKLYSGEIEVCKIPRYCPHCKKKLLKYAGEVEIINVGLIGHQSAGKTVYLTIQDYILKHYDHDKIIKVPYGNLIINKESSYLAGEVDTIQQSSASFMTDRKFPDSTKSIPSPHCLSIAYRKENETTNLVQSVVCFRDILGEFFTNPQIIDEKEKEYLLNSDVLLVLTDPEAFSLNGTVGENDSFNAQYSDMNDILHDIFSDSQGEVSQKTVCILTKEDLVADYVSRKTGKLSNIPQDSCAVAGGFTLNYQNEVDMYEKLKKLSEDTNKCLKDITKGSWWTNMLFDLFGSAVYIPISSIGQDCKIIDQHLVSAKSYDSLMRRKAEEKGSFKISSDDTAGALANLNPRFITLPLMYILEQKGIIPPIYRKESYVIEEKTIKEGFFKLFRKTETVVKFDQEVYDRWVAQWRKD